MELADWISEVSDPRWGVFAKRLSGNDTGLTLSHQSGLYMPKSVAFTVLPELERPLDENPDTQLRVVIDSHSEERRVRAVWYNQKTRDEARITRWGGRSSPVQDPENTGALCLMAFAVDKPFDSGWDIRIWVCRNVAEDELARAWVGESVDPGDWVLLLDGQAVDRSVPVDRCDVHQGDLPPSWGSEFPSGEEIIDFVGEVMPTMSDRSPDRRILERRDCEFTVFSLIEKLHVLPKILDGFPKVDSFLAMAHSVTNRRKARAGRSLELHLKLVFQEEGIDFAHGAVVDGGTRPDFLFPSEAAYREFGSSGGDLRMLGVKTTLKDRWRQVLNEADKIPAKHLFTLQEGVSEMQFREMVQAKVTLVVPESIISTFPPSTRPELMTLAAFCREVRELG